jgi:transcriptional regulator with XRE-family HTH domain
MGPVTGTVLPYNNNLRYPMSACLMTSLGHNIRAERVRNGYSQGILAEKTGLNRTYIGIVERGEKNITVCNCSKIADALHIPLSDLIRKAEESFVISCNAEKQDKV